MNDQPAESKNGEIQKQAIFSTVSRGRIMKRRFYIQVAIFALSLCAALAGCSSGTSNSNDGPSSAIKTAPGQWEFTFGSTASTALNVEVNFSPNGEGVAADSDNTVILSMSEFNGYGNNGSYPGSAFCSGYYLAGSVAGNVFSGQLQQGGSSNSWPLSGIIAADGQSVSQGGSNLPSSLCGLPDFAVPSQDFSATLVSPLNGTFTGTLTRSDGNTDSVSIQITQNSSLQLAATGTFTTSNANGTATITIPSTNSGCSGDAVVGATFQACGTATDISGISGTTDFSIVGHFNAGATQVTIHSYNSNTGVGESGMLNKQ